MENASICIKSTLQHTECPIFVGDGISADENLIRANVPACDRIFLLADRAVFSLHGQAVLDALNAVAPTKAVLLDVSENQKSMDTVQMLYREMESAFLSRHSLVAALGGGIVTDLAGFIAATYLRGLPLLSVPSTLTAQIDAAIGGKNGVNFSGYKNQIGTFHVPCAVLADTSLLTTLPAGVLRDGYAELIKYGAIAEEALFSRVSSAELPSAEDLAACIRIKTEICQRDPFDQAERHLLNFGHTLGHALESVSRHTLSHGEAVGIGMCFAAELGEALHCTVPGTAAQMRGVLDRKGLPTHAVLSHDAIMDAVGYDKKRTGDTISFVFLKKIGEAFSAPTPLSVVNDFLSRSEVLSCSQ